MSNIAAGAWSETGMRSRNEDSYAEDLERSILVIADGMGGHSNGHEASQEAVRTALDHLRSAEDVGEALSSAILAAHRAVSSHGDNRGTTLTIAHIRENTLRIAHVGDTRLYLDSKQITRDQGVGYVLEEFVGGEYPPVIQQHSLRLTEPCWLLLSTDGIHDVLPIEHVFIPTVSASGEKPQMVAKMLSLASVHAGSTDNCTCIVAHWTPSAPESPKAA